MDDETVHRTADNAPNGHSASPRVGVLYFTFSGQTHGLVNQLVRGMREAGCIVEEERLHPIAHLRFPLTSIFATFSMMLATFFRQRFPIQPLDSTRFRGMDLYILAGPTWSYQPSGPILSLLDRHGTYLFADGTVIPLISCRGYWRTHWYGLRHILEKKGAHVPGCIVFTHPNPEPWRTIGVFLKIAGRNPERFRFFGRLYTQFGHSRPQRQEAFRMGTEIGVALRERRNLAELKLRTPTSLPFSWGSQVRNLKRSQMPGH